MNNFFKRLGRAVKSFWSSGARTFFGGVINSFLRRTSTEIDPYANFAGWAYWAIDKIADSVRGIKLHLYELDRNGDVVEIEDHDLLNLLYKPNTKQTKSDFFYLLAVYLKIWGSAPVYLEKNGNRIIRMWPMRPDLVRYVYNREATQIVGYEYHVGTNVITMAPDEFINIKKPNPQNPDYGYSPMKAIGLEIDIDAATTVWNRFAIENTVDPSFILSTDSSLTDEEFDRAKNQINQKYAGAENARKTMVLEGGLTPTVITGNSNQNWIIDNRKFNRDTVVSLLGVPKALATSDEVNKANAEAAKRQFAEETIEPMMTLIVEQFDEFLVPLFEDNLWLDHDSPVPQDRENMRADATAGVNTWLTINEVRAMYNLAPLEGGDVLYQPMAILPGAGPIAQKGTKIEEAQWRELTVKDKKFMDVKKKAIKAQILARTRQKRNASDAFSRALEQKMAGNQILIKGVKGEGNNVIIKIAAAKDEDIDESYDDPNLPDNIKQDRRIFLKALAKKRKNFQSILKAYFNDQESRVLKNLEEAGEPKGIKSPLDWVRDVLLDPIIEALGLAKLSRESIRGAILDGSLQISVLLGSTATDIFQNPRALKYLSEKPMKFAGDVTETTMNAVRDTLLEGVEANEGIGKLTQRVSGVFDQARGFRAETIARTETGGAMNIGRLEEMRDLGVEEKMWVAIFSNTREDHAAAHGQVVGIDEDFDVGGYSAKCPHDSSLPADEVINCQCSSVPKIKK